MDELLVIKLAHITQIFKGSSAFKNGDHLNENCFKHLLCKSPGLYVIAATVI